MTEIANYHYIFFWIGTSIYLLYNILIVSIYGVLPSVSESFYRLPKKYNFLFILFCWFFPLPLFVATEVPLIFGAAAGIAFVGAAAKFYDGFVGRVHFTAAIGAVILSQLAIIFNFHFWEMSAVFTVLSILVIKSENRVFWIEQFAFLSIIITIFLSMYIW